MLCKRINLKQEHVELWFLLILEELQIARVRFLIIYLLFRKIEHQGYLILGDNIMGYLNLLLDAERNYQKEL